MPAQKPKTKILVDGGDPAETSKIKELLGYVDGQTTNPTLIAKNPDICKLVASGHRLSGQEENEVYKSTVQRISLLVGDAGVSIEIFSDLDTPAEEMLTQGKEMFSWIPNAYVKYPCTREGLRAAQMSVREGIRVNLTLCFSQDQAADGRVLEPLPYRSLNLNDPWENFNIAHELTTKGVQRFVEDYQSTLKKIA